MTGIKKHQDIPTKWEEREKLREKGQFWTPSWVAKGMVSYAAKNTDIVFDPATGRGAFFEALLKLNNSKISFFGVDIDSEILDDDIYEHTNCKVELRDFIKNPPKKKFQAIVANPPYIRHHRIDEATKEYLKNLAVSIIGQKIDGRAGYHIYFLIQALNLLGKNGRLAFIMPADTCEGVFSKQLWKWISESFCIDAVITFDAKATPFPNVDTNAIVFLIRNNKPQKYLYWIRAIEAYTNELFDFISSDFNNFDFQTIEIVKRELIEAITTGLSRPEQVQNDFRYHLFDFAKVMRGIATGSNDFFFLTSKQVKDSGIPIEFFKRAIGRTKDVTENLLNRNDLDQLDANGRPTYLLSINGQNKYPNTLLKYLRMGEDLGLPEKSLIKQRNPWFKMEQREVPPILFAYLGRRNTRFILNNAQVLPLTGFLCVYPIYSDKDYIENLWQALNESETIENLKLVGKSYGSGAIKVEPRNLNKLPVPEHIVLKFGLNRKYKLVESQMEIFREKKKKYRAQKGKKT